MQQLPEHIGPEPRSLTADERAAYGCLLLLTPFVLGMLVGVVLAMYLWGYQ